MLPVLKLFPWDQTPSKLMQKIWNTYQKRYWGGSNSRVGGFAIGRKHHPREEDSCTGTPHRKEIPPTKQKVSIQKFTSRSPRRRKRFAPASCNSPGHSHYHSCGNHSCIQNTGFLLENVFLKTLGDFRQCHFSVPLQEAHVSQMNFKEQLHETLHFHIAGTYLQETFCLVDSFQEASEFFFILVIINYTPGAL